MILTKKLKKILIGWLLFLTITCCFFALSNSLNTASAATVIISTDKIESGYKQDSIVVLPDSLKVEFGGEEYDAIKGMIISPDGKSEYIDNNGILLDKLGNYEVRYFFTADNDVKVTAKKIFTVYNNVYEFKSDNGSSSVTKVNESSEIPCQNNDDNVLYSKKDGLIVRLANGAQFAYNKPLDLSKTDGVAPIIEIDPRLHKLQYTGDLSARYSYNYDNIVANKLHIRLTDCYNSLNYVDVMIDAGREAIHGSVYVRAMSSNMSNYYGFNFPDNGEIIRPDSQVEMYMDGQRGTSWKGDFGTYYIMNAFASGADVMSLFYDNELDRLYYRCGKQEKIICDFKNESIFGSNIFEGFTTGEVYLTIEAKDYKTTDLARVDILSIGGEKATTLNDGKLEYVDTVSPQIKIDIAATNENNVYVAKGESFEIPSAKVNDVNFAGKLNVIVYRGYKQDRQYSVKVKDNSFVVDKADRYSVVYTATDIYGNKTEKILEVIGVDADSSLEINVDKLQSAQFALNNILPIHSVSTLNDADSVKVKITAIYGDEIQEISADDRVFLPKNLGKYTIVYQYSDNVFIKTFQYDIVVTSDSNVLFLQEPHLNKYLIKGANYQIEGISALVKDATGNFVETKADAYVAFDNSGNFTKVSNMNKCLINGTESVQLKFSYNGTDSKIANAKIIDLGYEGEETIELYKYFAGDFNVITKNGEEIVPSITYDSNITSGNNTLEFVNPVNFKQFQFEYKIPEGKDNFEKLNVKFINPKDTSETFCITLRNQKGKTFLSINGDRESIIPVAFVSQNNMTIICDQEKNSIVVSGINFPTEFKMSCDLAYLEVELEGITGESSITINKLNNVMFSNYIFGDYYQPEINIEKAYGQYVIGDVVEIHYPVFSDVMSQIEYSSIKLEAFNDKGYLVSKDNVLLDGRQEVRSSYFVELLDYGTYTVKYQATDEKGYFVSGQYSFTVIDKVAPEISFSGNYNEDSPLTISAGETVSVKYNVSDNKDAKKDLTVRVNVISDASQVMRRDVGNQFKLTEKGSYTVYLYCEDSDGNYLYRYFNVIVK